jgi:hypothetical protein
MVAMDAQIIELAVRLEADILSTAIRLAVRGAEDDRATVLYRLMRRVNAVLENAPQTQSSPLEHELMRIREEFEALTAQHALVDSSTEDRVAYEALFAERTVAREQVVNELGRTSKDVIAELQRARYDLAAWRSADTHDAERCIARISALLEELDQLQDRGWRVFFGVA